MSDKELIALMSLVMCSDPWPTDHECHETIDTLLNNEAQKRGHKNWIVAIHEMVAPLPEKSI